MEAQEKLKRIAKELADRKSRLETETHRESNALVFLQKQGRLDAYCEALDLVQSIISEK